MGGARRDGWSEKIGPSPIARQLMSLEWQESGCFRVHGSLTCHSQGESTPRAVRTSAAGAPQPDASQDRPDQQRERFGSSRLRPGAARPPRGGHGCGRGCEAVELDLDGGNRVTGRRVDRRELGDGRGGIADDGLGEWQRERQAVAGRQTLAEEAQAECLRGDRRAVIGVVSDLDRELRRIVGVELGRVGEDLEQPGTLELCGWTMETGETSARICGVGAFDEPSSGGEPGAAALA